MINLNTFNNFELKSVGPQKRIEFSEAQKDYIVEKYIKEKDASSVTIGKEFGVSYPLIKRVLKERKVKAKTLRSFRKQYELNQDFFEVIDSEHKAYWLGFLYADGVIIEKENLVRINLAAIDKNHLEKFKKSIGSTHIVKDTNKIINNKEYKLNYISIKCSKMCKDLINKGCIQNKSFVLKFPYEHVPKELLKHFIRGYIDGDGSINNTVTKTGLKAYRVSAIGTYDIIYGILKHLNSDLIPRKEGKNNYYTMSLGGNIQSKRVLEYLYKDASIYLERKFQKANEIFNYKK